MPSGENVWNQTIRKKRKRNAGSLEALRRQLWAWLQTIDDGLQASIEAGDQETAIRWLHVGSQLSGTYVRATVDGALEARLDALEAKLSEPLQ